MCSRKSFLSIKESYRETQSSTRKKTRSNSQDNNSENLKLDSTAILYDNLQGADDD